MASTRMAPWRNRIISNGTLKVTDALANPLNFRIHPAQQRQALETSLDNVGWVQQVVVNTQTGNLLDGHLRLRLAEQRGESELPCLYVELSEDEERLVLASLDPIAAMASVDRDKLQELFSSIQREDEAVRDLLASIASHEGIELPTAGGLTDPDEVPDVPEEPASRLGDVWVMGKHGHRLGCGDGTDAATVQHVIGGGQPRLLVVDGPYGISLDMEWRDRALYNKLGPAQASYMKQRRGGQKISGDTIADWSAAYELVPSLEVAYVWHASAHMVEVATGLARLGFELRQQIIWVKPVHVISRSAYHWRHEPCLYAVKKGASAGWIGTRDQSTVWELASPKQIMAGSAEQSCAHPCQKPLECMARPVRNHSGDVWDCFAGSGTTLIACEMEGRTFYGMDIEPRYVDVACLRWAAYTGQQPVLDGDGRTFAEVAAERSARPT